MDVFDPVAFNAVLDYMYGHPITVTVDSADVLLKVIRRLELHGLEQSMWIFLMKAIDANNCNQLHELSDRYDCAPLKLAAWRYIQQAISGPSKHHDEALRGGHKGTGLTGPGEAGFYRNVTMQEKMDEERNQEDLIKAHSGIIMSHSTRERSANPNAEQGDDEDKEAEDDDEDDDLDLNEPIDTHLSSADFVFAWSKRLDAVYRDCTVDPNDIQQNDGAVAQAQHSIMLGSRARQAPAHSAEPTQQMGGSPRDRSRTPPRSPGREAMGKPAHMTPGDIDWHSELKGFYLGIHKPEKLPFLDELVTANAGKEEQMLSHLMMKYKRIIPESLANHLDTLQGFLETHAEGNFYR